MSHKPYVQMCLSYRRNCIQLKNYLYVSTCTYYAVSLVNMFSLTKFWKCQFLENLWLDNVCNTITMKSKSVEHMFAVVITMSIMLNFITFHLLYVFLWLFLRHSLNAQVGWKLEWHSKMIIKQNKLSVIFDMMIDFFSSNFFLNPSSWIFM
jgi:hypothetical protein